MKIPICNEHRPNSQSRGARAEEFVNNNLPKDRFYFVSYTARSNTFTDNKQVIESSLIDIHPLEFVIRENSDKNSDLTLVLISWQEISRDEYNISGRDFIK